MSRPPGKKTGGETPYERSLHYRQHFEYVGEVPDFLKKLTPPSTTRQHPMEEIDTMHHLSKEEKQAKRLGLKRGSTQTNPMKEEEDRERPDEQPVILALDQYLTEAEQLEQLRKQEVPHERQEESSQPNPPPTTASTTHTIPPPNKPIFKRPKAAPKKGHPQEGSNRRLLSFSAEEEV